MERFTPLERVDEGRILSEAERLLVSGDLHGFENFVHALEASRQQYLEIERQSTAAARQIKEAFLPVLEQVVEKIFALNKDAATFNRTVAVAHLPQTQFLQCRIDLTQLLAALVELNVVVTPEMEQLAASAQGLETKTENSTYRPAGPVFGTEERT